MSLSIERFEEFFAALYRDRERKPLNPFPWQSRLAREVFKVGWPQCIDLPTASGKTTAIDIAVFVLACQAGVDTNNRHVGRRIFFTVNRRVIVDDAYSRAIHIAQNLRDAKNGILKDVADALREISGDTEAPPLDVAELRGGVYRDRAWARSMTQSIVVCTTADQLGSRLLFRGYGVTTSMQPVHAALTACDSLILLDEAHVTKAFSQTLGLISRYRQEDGTSPPMRFVQMTATPAGNIPESKRFSLRSENLNAKGNEKLKARQEADKIAELVPPLKKSFVDNIVERASKAVNDTRKAIGIIVNRVQTARDIHERLSKEFPRQTYLVIGRMRPLDRDNLQQELRTLVGPDRPDNLEQLCFVVATQCLEVGADYDFDALFTECASLDALRQRFGRLNRTGRKIDVDAAIFTTEASVKDEDPIYGEALKNTWDWLTERNRKQINFGISEFTKLWQVLDDRQRDSMLAPAPDAAVLLPAHLDTLCQTSPQPVPSPDVSYFIHGPQRDNFDVNACWRADLDDQNTAYWPKIVGQLPPTSPECMTVPLRTIVDWMRGRSTKNDADVAVTSVDEETRESGERLVLVWRGKDDATVTQDPRQLQPGDTVVIPAWDTSSYSLGHIPARQDGTRSLDVAEKAYAQARRQRIVRIHKSVHPELPPEILDYAVSNEMTLGKSRIRELLGSLAEGFNRGPDEIEYPDGSGLLLRFNDLLPDEHNPFRPSRCDDDGNDSTAESTRQVSLEAHTKHVVDSVIAAADPLHLNSHRTTVVESANLHDIGKADVRFQALLAGLSPYEAIDRPILLAKSAQRSVTPLERRQRRSRAQLPADFRHEILSVEILSNGVAKTESQDRDLLLHLIAAHHGHARPFAPVMIDNATDETLSLEVLGISIKPEHRLAWIPSHRLDSGVAERFWKLTKQYGWWGLAWLESILRLSDQQASAREEKEGHDDKA